MADRRVLTPHAIQRYRRRVARGATLDRIQAHADRAELRANAPQWVEPGPDAHADLYLVDGDVVFPCTRHPDALIVLTTLRRHRRGRHHDHPDTEDDLDGLTLTGRAHAYLARHGRH